MPAVPTMAPILSLTVGPARGMMPARWTSETQEIAETFALFGAERLPAFTQTLALGGRQ